MRDDPVLCSNCGRQMASGLITYRGNVLRIASARLGPHMRLGRAPCAFGGPISQQAA